MAYIVGAAPRLEAQRHFSCTIRARCASMQHTVVLPRRSAGHDAPKLTRLENVFGAMEGTLPHISLTFPKFKHCIGVLI